MCYRAQAKPNEFGMQSYDAFDDAGEGCCDSYIPVEPEWKKKYLE